MVGAPTYPNDGDYPAHSSTQRSSNAPTARPQGQQRSEASSQTSSPEAQRGSGTATRPAAPPPLLRIAAAPQPQQLHRPLPTRDRRLQNPPCIGMSRHSRCFGRETAGPAARFAHGRARFWVKMTLSSHPCRAAPGCRRWVGRARRDERPWTRQGQRACRRHRE